MKDIPDGSVDMILCDLPYGTIKGMQIDGYKCRGDNATEWDVKLDTNLLFKEYERILRENGVAILFSQEPYTSEIRTCKFPNFDFIYSMIWEKDHFANALIAKKAPVSYFEDLSVFVKPYDSQNLNPLRQYATKLYRWLNMSKKEILTKIGQKADHFFRVDSMQFKLCTLDTYNDLITKLHIDMYEEFKPYNELVNMNSKYQKIYNLPINQKIKSNILKYKKDYQGFHPTQKPVALLEDLISTYTTEEMTVLDNCMGSGSTGVACVNTNRKFIGIELDEKYFEIAKNRIEQMA